MIYDIRAGVHNVPCSSSCFNSVFLAWISLFSYLLPIYISIHEGPVLFCTAELIPPHGRCVVVRLAFLAYFKTVRYTCALYS